MLTIAYYFLQVVLCSIIMMGYYWLMLRNKKFHQYNRFYLLGAALLSWFIPLIKINVSRPIEEAPAQLINLASIVAGNNSEIEQLIVQKDFAINWDMVIISLYGCICTIFLFSIVAALLRVYHLLRKHSCRSLGDVYLIMTANVRGTPFSFFQYIFWNEAVDMQTPIGQQIMQHELAHVREKHSVDKLFMQIVIMFGWFNPFFWLLKKELNLIHEFIADKKAVQDGDASSLAAMLLTAAYPNQQYLLTNPFFFSPIKRRILMLTKTNNPRLSYARRVVVLPLLAVTVMLFAFRKKETAKNIAPLNKVYTVVIDAGHGGKDLGATAADGTAEKDLALQLLKAVKNANTNDKIKLVFTREEDVYQSPIDKAKFVNGQKADLFISLHINWSAQASELERGFEINVPGKQLSKAAIEQSNLLAKHLAGTLFKEYPSQGVHIPKKGIWVLTNSYCPSVLIECGNINNPKDLALLKDEKQRNKMAGLILEGIGNYLANSKDLAEISLDQKSISDSLSKEDFDRYMAIAKSCQKEIKTKEDKAMLVIDASRVPQDELGEMYKKMNNRQKGLAAKVFIVKKNEASSNKEGSLNKRLNLLKNVGDAFMLSPLNNGYIKERFGKNIILQRAKYLTTVTNDGIKICSKTDNNVKSITSGTVSFTGKISDEQVVIVRSDNKFISYSGMSSTNLQKGQTISVGTSIGEAGSMDNENYVSLLVTDNAGKFLNPENLFAMK